MQKLSKKTVREIGKWMNTPCWIHAAKVRFENGSSVSHCDCTSCIESMENGIWPEILNRRGK